MNRWKIMSSEGVYLGIYDGETAEQAIEELARDAGYASAAAMNAATNGDDLEHLVLGTDWVGTDGKSISGFQVDAFEP